MVITLGGEYGCGAKRIAEDGAAALGYTLCDDTIIAAMAQECGIDVKSETFTYYDESDGTSSVTEIQRLSGLSRNGYADAVSSLAYDTVPLDKRISESQNRILNALADKGNCIILGRCADYYLRGRTDVMRIWCCNAHEKRVTRISQFFSISEREAAKLIRKTDKRRADYYEYFTGRKWSDFTNYDMVLNVDTIGIERCIEILQGLSKMGPRTEDDPTARVPEVKKI